MTLPVSTSGNNELVERCCGTVFGGVVGNAVEPAAPDHADPGAGQHADGVRVVLARLAGLGVDLRGPGAGVPAVVGEGGQRSEEHTSELQSRDNLVCRLL